MKKPAHINMEIEVNNLREFRQALKARPDIIMLDNMKPGDVKKAVIIRNMTQEQLKHKTQLEASGNIDLTNVRFYARTGVDRISLGTLTKDIRSLDLSLKIK